jgi:hypothetical protein
MLNGIRARLTERSWDTNDETRTSTKLLGQVDLSTGVTLSQRDGRDSISDLDHDCGWECVEGRVD